MLWLKWNWKRKIFPIIFVCLCVIVAKLIPPCLWPYIILKQFSKLSKNDNADVTLVTAYFNLGNLNSKSSPYKFLHWASVFQYVQNPLVIYTDSDQIANMFLSVRKHLVNNTHVIKISKFDLMAFRDLEKLGAIFSNPDYPKFFPNTVLPEYSCIQHSKYEIVKKTIIASLFSNTKYIAWIDIGYFRYITSRRRRFWIVTPPGMDDAKVAVNEVFSPDFTHSMEDIFKRNLVWVGGGMSLATRSVYFRFAEEYQRAAAEFLRQGFSNTDQQVIYAMFTELERKALAVKTEFQIYSWCLNLWETCWFYLGYLCYREME